MIEEEVLISGAGPAGGVGPAEQAHENVAGEGIVHGVDTHEDNHVASGKVRGEVRGQPDGGRCLPHRRGRS